MASVLSRRLGKRSLLGTRVSAPDGVLVAPQIHALPADLSRPLAPLAPPEDGSCPRAVEESSRAPRFPSPGHHQLCAGQQVLVTYSGQEFAGLAEQHDPPSDKVKVLQPEQGSHTCWRMQDTRPDATEALQRSVSSSIDVPKRKDDAAVEMDEMVAAMVLTSLSCSPVVQSPPASDSGIPPSRAVCDPWKESGDVSDSGSSTTSGHWSGGSDISTPSPPHPEGSPKHSSEALSSPPADDGFETDSDPFLLDEPAPRKRKNSVKVMYKCLWPSCGKVLRSIVGIKRHVRTQHLGDSADSEQRKREEDFYYTEVQVKEEPAPETVAAASPTSVSSSSPIIIQQALAKPEALLLEPPALEPALASSALSQSAPSSFWHIQADHAYQVSSSHPPAPFAGLGGFKGAQGLLLRLFQSQGSCRPPLLPCNYPAVVCNTPCSRQIEPGRNAAVPDPARPCCSGNLEIWGGGLVAGPCPMSPATAALGAAGAERGGTDPEAACVSVPTWALN
uniref:Zinc finger protein 395 n=1 Tax=Anas zonorhyncha TaxID=75864 RepID=A0A8B9UQ26_9AVES